MDGTNGITTTRQPRYDASGNLVDDGYRYIYIYDSRNRLVQVNRRDPSSNSADHVGSVFAKFSYNALGWRTSAVYDLHDKSIGSDTQLEGTSGAGGGGRSESRGRVEDGGDGSFDDETVEYYSYDDQWRLIAIERQGPKITSGTNAGKRPAPRHYQRIVYSPTEQRGFGGGSIPTDVPIMRLRDTNGDGIYDETLYYLHNRHGDVVAMYQPRLAKPEPGSSVFDQPSPTDPRRALVLERYTYSLYGEPDCVQPLDVNGDGVVNVMEQIASEGSPFEVLSDTTAFQTAMSAPPFDSNDPVGGSLRADVDGDGYLTKWDEEYFNAYSYIHQLAQQDAMDLFNGWNIGDVENLGTWDGRGELSRWHEVGQTSDGGPTLRMKHSAWIALDNRLGYAGYVWDPHLKLYHVRHRVYDPREGTWLQEDPIGIAGGLNLHEYCNSDPINFVDPMGLDWLDTAITFAGVGDVLSSGLTFGVRYLTGLDKPIAGTNIPAAEDLRLKKINAAQTPDEIADAFQNQRTLFVANSINDGPLQLLKAGLMVEIIVVQIPGSAEELAVSAAGQLAGRGIQIIQKLGGKWFATLKGGKVVPLAKADIEIVEKALEKGNECTALAKRAGKVTEEGGKAGKQIKPAERAFAKELAEKGHDVHIRGNQPGGDFVVDGTLWELKTLESGRIETVRDRINDAKKQADHIFIDARGTNLSTGDALRAVTEACKYARYFPGAVLKACHAVCHEQIQSKDGRQAA